MPVASKASRLFVPPFPRRPNRPRGALSIILALRRNPIEIWCEADFERPVSLGRSILGLRGAAHDPVAVRRIFLDNAANYRKDDLQLRVLRPGLGSGLLTSEGDDWRMQRRALSPLFSPRQVADFAPAMQRVAEAAIERLSSRRDGAVTEIGALMSRMTLEVLEQTLFSQGLGREPSAFQRSVTSYFDTIGRLDPLDLVGAPSFLPRFGRRRGRPALMFFAQAVDDIIANRRALIDSGAEAPRDLLTLLLSARDPESGRGMSDEDMRANILTFILAGHETTANALTWTALSAVPVARVARTGGGRSRSVVRSATAGRDRGMRDVARRFRGSDAPLSAGGDAQSSGDRRRRTRGRAYSRRRGDLGLAICSAPAARSVGQSGRLRSVPLPGRTARAHRPFRLYPVRRRTACLHRHGLRDAGGDQFCSPTSCAPFASIWSRDSPSCLSSV